MRPASSGGGRPSRLAAAVLLASVLWMGAIPGASPASAQPPDPPARPGQATTAPAPHEFVPGQILVRFRPGVTPDRADRLIADRGLARTRHLKALGVHLLALPSGLTVERAVEIFSQLPEVEFAEPNYVMHIAQITDPGLANQWAPQKVDAPQAWLATEGDPSVVIAVVDTGVDYRHPELAPNMWSNSREVPGNGLDDDGNGYVDDVRGWDFVNGDGDPLDDHFHGTHVAGIAAAAPTGDSSGIVGICPRCRIMPVKALDSSGSGSLANVASGITYAADNGARVVNLSLGGSAGATTLESAVKYAWDHGVVVVAAAGNDGADSRLYPAAYPNAMAIAATNSDDYRSCFSSYGAGYVSVAAPGELIYSTTPLDASGKETYGTYSGTSMATPHVSGLAGLLFSQNPTRTNAEVRRLIESTAEDLGVAGVDPFFGAGRINADRAVRGDTSPTTPPAGLFSDDLSASGYPSARKLVRDASGTLHLVWHGQSGGQYRVLYSTSGDGKSWSAPQVVFASAAETYHPTLAAGGSDVYLAFPSKDGSSRYRVFFARKPLSGGSWSTPVALLGGQYNAVRPSLYVDPSNGRLHLVASSYDDAPYVYYTSSSDGGLSWSQARQVSVASTSGQLARYTAVHADGSRVYLAGRTVELTYFGLLPVFRLFTIRSVDGGASWSDLTEQAKYTGFASGEYGASLAGVGGRLYLAYEHGGAIYYRQSVDGAAWSTAASLGSGAWPSITQADDGRAWVAWESGGSLLLRRFNGTSWDSAETALAATALCKAYYPSLKLGTSGGFVEWVATNCSGSPYRLTFDSRALADMPIDPPAQFGAAQYAVGEGAGTATITVALGSASTRSVTVGYATSDGTAIAGKDYTATSGTLTFAPGETAKTFAVPVKEDTLDEADETILLKLSNPVDAVLGSPATATLTIQDNDLPPSVAFSSGGYYVHENAGSATITVRLGAASGLPVTVDYATADGTASAGSDYISATGTLTFAPGDTSETIAVPILEDALGEPNETIKLTLGNPTNAVLGTTAAATLTIYANDTLTFSSSYYNVHENAGSATITVRLNAPSALPVTVDYSTGDGAALAGSDYVATSGMLAFAPGETSKTFAVSILDDALPEPNETVKLTLGNPTNAVLGTAATATLTIYANDTLSFSGGYYSVQENAGSATITVRLNAPSSQAVTVGYAAADGTAKAGADYTATSGTLTFNPGETSKTFAVPIIDDALGEPNETVALSLSNAVGAALGSPATATLTIYASDTLTFSSSGFYVQENAGVATVTVRLSGPSSQTVTVDYATSDGTAKAGSDYIATSGTLTFVPGDTSEALTIPILDDALGEPNETVALALSNPTNAVLGSPSTATLTIYANDTLAFGSSAYFVSENAGSAAITVRLSGPSSQPVSVSYATADGTALAGSDYVATSGTLTFNPGETSKTFAVPIVDDALQEPNETISLTLSNPVNAVLGSPSTATLTIWASDPP